MPKRKLIKKNRVPIEKNGMVLTQKQIDQLVKLLKPFCPSFGNNYNPQKECALCPANVLCMKAQSTKAKVKIKRYTEASYHNKYYLDEYLRMVEKPGHLLKMQEAFLTAIAEKDGAWVKFKSIKRALEKKRSHWYYVDYMKTHDKRFPLIFFYSLGNFENIEMDYENRKVRYKKSSKAKTKAS